MSHQDFLQAVGNVLQLAPPSKRSRTYSMQHTVHTHESQKEPRNNFKQTWWFFVSSVPSLELLSLMEDWPTSGSQAGEVMVVRQSYAAGWAGEGPSGRDRAPLGVKGGEAERGGHGQNSHGLRYAPWALAVCPVEPPSEGVQTAPCRCYLPFPELAHFTSVNTLCVLWILAKKILMLYNHLQHWYFRVFFFQNFLVHTD